MRWIGIALVAVMLTGLAGCSSKFKTYDGPEVTRVLIYKENRKMYLMHNEEVLKAYDVGLGFAPEGDKTVRGDGRTPEGDYRVDRRNPNSEFHLSIGIDYPNAEDRAYARSIGKDPGGDIFIHGRPWKYRKGGEDWTAGCVAVTNSEIEDVYSMIKVGTLVSIYR
ncbi:L,D-transpeptidase catalytic domain [Shimia gijangensis]|uniref:L,D-transpeptidase catalytic domain n=1 Tax=Shimia gijangensis TaxID=1470563 RepID=A0A1M6MPI3_9RHOB|nr:L,D-transpeptidase family protein [Shimia gijangensis]SHJ85377.1 L,D-transpeptidase catalytic domain [Shimia gijangensis]